jgi:hypothetical protein
MRQSFEPLRATIEKYKEHNCCTVVALACTLDWSFGKAHRHMAKHGRKPRRGMNILQWLPALTDAAEKDGKTVREYRSAEGLTIKRFAKENPNGVFYVRVNKHALAVVNGKMQDWTAETAGRRKIINCYKIEG